jgi:hypothetical protein
MKRLKETDTGTYRWYVAPRHQIESLRLKFGNLSSSEISHALANAEVGVSTAETTRDDDRAALKQHYKDITKAWSECTRLYPGERFTHTDEAYRNAYDHRWRLEHTVKDVAQKAQDSENALIFARVKVGDLEILGGTHQIFMQHHYFFHDIT